jgi:hypothetical protein
MVRITLSKKKKSVQMSNLRAVFGIGMVLICEVFLQALLLGSVVDPHILDADPDADLDSTYQPDADRDSDFYLMRIGFGLFTLMWIRIRI